MYQIFTPISFDWNERKEIKIMIRLVRGLSANSFKPQLLSGLSTASRAYATKRGGEVEVGGR
jgi:hypothetical protein